MKNYIFGYGSIINDESRLKTLGCSCADDEAVAVYLSPEFGYFRSWCYRSNTGFTALGLIPMNNQKYSSKICGIIFPVSNTEALNAFDEREQGYERVLVNVKMVEINHNIGCHAAKARAKELELFLQSTNVNIWTYVPTLACLSSPDDEYPILQTYVDVCLRGCLAWGGEEYMKDFIRSTYGWSDFFLNDALLSRRPWLHRPDYKAVDTSLELFSEHTKFHERKHPEEFASRYMSVLRGMWGVPLRNVNFVGRTNVIVSLHHNFTTSATRSAENACPNIATSSSGLGECPMIGLRQVEIIGLGGVGKTQVAIEYVHRYYGSYYGLVAWIKAESVTTIAADIRKLAFDLGILQKHQGTRPSCSENSSVTVQGSTDSNTSTTTVSNSLLRERHETSPAAGMDDESVVDEVKRRLARCKCRWLLVFDNVDDHSLLRDYLPRGTNGSSAGHILVTSRITSSVWQGQASRILLDCFNIQESIQFLEASLEHDGSPMKSRIGVGGGGQTLAQQQQQMSRIKSQDMARHAEQLHLLADQLGCLPLALAMATAYMQRCDVSVSEYLDRIHSLVLLEAGTSRDAGVGTGIVTSFNLTLDRISNESTASTTVLPCLGFVASDYISKSLLQMLLKVTNFEKMPRYASDAGCCFLSFFVRECLQRRHTRVMFLVSSVTLMVSVCGLVWSCVTTYSLGRTVYYNFLYRPSRLEECVGGVVDFATCSTNTSTATFTFGTMHHPSVFILLFVTFVSGLCLKFSYNKFWWLCFRSKLRGLGVPQSVLSTDCSQLPIKHTRLWNSRRAAWPFARWWNGRSSTALFADYEDSQLVVTNDEELRVQTDHVWDTLRQYSLLTVRGTRSYRLGSIHRLQQSVLRARNPKASSIYIEYCIEVLVRAWANSPYGRGMQAQAGMANDNNYISSSSTGWDCCNELLPHIETVTEHALHHITGTARQAPFSATDKSTSGSSSFGTGSAKCPISWYYAFRLSQILSEAGSYCSLVLSRFDTARQYLEKALEVQDLMKLAADNGVYGNFLCRGDLRLQAIEKANALHQLGKVLRYNGRLEDSWLTLGKALILRKKEVSGRPVSSAVADTLHEIGVLCIKRQAYDKANEYLSRSLKMKRKVSSLRKNSESQQRSWLSFFGPKSEELYPVSESGEAATLHQLAVVATTQRRYEVAEELLLQALQLERQQTDEEGGLQGGGSRLVRRAATLQQLGRVAMRRGRLSEAEENLLEALELYEQAYGRKCAGTHINVAAVRHQLGSNAYAAQRYDDACVHLQLALEARQAVCNQSFHSQLDLVFELQALGKAEMGRGAHAEAEKLFDQQRALCERLLEYIQTTMPNKSKSPTALTQLNIQQQLQQLSETYTESRIRKYSDVSLIDAQSECSEDERVTHDMSDQFTSGSQERDRSESWAEDTSGVSNGLILEKDRRRKVVHKALLFALTSLRQLASLTGDLAKKKARCLEILNLTKPSRLAEDYSSTACSLSSVPGGRTMTSKKGFGTAGQTAANTNANESKYLCDAVNAALKARTSVRSICTLLLNNLAYKSSDALKKKTASGAEDSTGNTLSPVSAKPVIEAQVQSLLEKLRVDLHTSHKRVTQIHSLSSTSSPSGSNHGKVDNTREIGVVYSASETFVKSVHVLVYEYMRGSVSSKQLVQRLFVNCDVLRSDLRAIGFKIIDE